MEPTQHVQDDKSDTSPVVEQAQPQDGARPSTADVDSVDLSFDDSSTTATVATKYEVDESTGAAAAAVTEDARADLVDLMDLAMEMDAGSATNGSHTVNTENLMDSDPQVAPESPVSAPTDPAPEAVAPTPLTDVASEAPPSGGTQSTAAAVPEAPPSGVTQSRAAAVPVAGLPLATEADQAQKTPNGQEENGNMDIPTIIYTASTPEDPKLTSDSSEYDLEDEDEQFIADSVNNNSTTEADDDFDFDLPPPPASNAPKPAVVDTDDVDPEFDFDFPQPAAKRPPVPVHVELCLSEATDESCKAVAPPVVDSSTSRPTETPPEGSEEAGHIAAAASDITPPAPVSATPTVEITLSEPTEDGQTAKSEELQAAEAEWEAVQTVVPGETKVNVSAIPNISFHETFQYFHQMDTSLLQPQIKTCVQRRGLSALSHMLFGPPKLQRDLVTERDLVFCIALCPLDNENEVHIRILQTLFKRLTGSKFDCPRFGSHWEQIGFQGNDPGTDLRGTGLLGLLNILAMVTDPKTVSLARDIYKLSQHETQNFPFSVMGLNMTRVAIQALREDCLNKECNKRRDVISVINEFYTGMYLQVYQIWKQQHKTIADSGFVLREVEIQAKKNPKSIFKGLETYLAQKKQVGAGDAGEAGTSEDTMPVKFSDLGQDDSH